jgi:hypothetical protein
MRYNQTKINLKNKIRIGYSIPLEASFKIML